jgi:hypothetical protein
MPIPFLKTVAKAITELNVPLQNICVLFPNRRAEIFFKKYLAELISEPAIAPLLLTAEEFVAQLTGIHPLKGNALLFEAYKTYLKLDLKSHDSFEDFMKWANTALYDFNEIDRHLVASNDLFENMVSAKTIERWGADDEGTYILIDRFLEIWKIFKPLYHALTKTCQDNKMGWQGLAYRAAAENLETLESFSAKKNITHFVFAGFNALNKAEEKIVEHLLKEKKCTIYWDSDAYYINNEKQEAGYFIREKREMWKRYSGSVHFNGETMLNDKNVNIYATGGSLDQAQKVGEILNGLTTEATNTAVVLADENLLMPVLNSIPEDFKEVNVTMGMGLRQANPGVFVLTAMKVKSKLVVKPTIYFKDLQRLLEFGPVANSLGEKGKEMSRVLLNKLKEQNLVFLRSQEMDELLEECNATSSFLKSLYTTEDPHLFLIRLVDVLEGFAEKQKLSAVEKEIYFNVISVVRSLVLDLENAKIELSYTIVTDLFKTALSAEQVAFYGEPLMGLQIMGILETRTLDFENLILTTVNEGVLPSGKSNNSFIPYDIRRYYKMPVHNERDAIYAYHFFRLLQRAKNIHLIYNNTSGGIGGKEKSRFIRQIENEWKGEGVTISEKESSIFITDDSLDMFTQVEKSALLKSDILDFLQKGVTPTALSEYVRNPLDFYFNKILRVREENELEEVVGYATLGVVVHDVLEDLYKPFIGSFPGKDDFKAMVKSVPALLEAKFKEHYKKGQLNEGKNLLVLQVARTMIFNFLKIDEKTSQELLLKGTPVELISLEEKLVKSVYLKELNIDVKFTGKADRIEKRGNDIYIVDYKTGAVEQKNLEIKDLSEIFDAEKKKEKVLQLLMYAYMFDKKKLGGGNVYGAVFSLRKFSQGAMVARLNEGYRNKTDLVFDANFEKEFEEILLLKICELHEGKGRFEDINVNSLEQPENQT